MSNYAYKGKEVLRFLGLKQSKHLAARTEISADLNPILLKPLGNYRSSVFVQRKILYKKMYADDYYKKFVQEKME